MAPSGRGAAAAARGAGLPLPSPRSLAALRRRLLAWYDARGRDLPWRARPSLYGTWIAEMMLQQTTVAAAAPYWDGFLRRFPDVRALARASEADVLQAWAGLGYYRRARDLHAAARLIVARDAGRLPADRAGWRALPGIGAYTAGAIASIGLGEAVPAVDANARRVLLRLTCASAAAAAAAGPAALETAAAAFVDPGRPGDWNQALMDLASALCRPVAPACEACPVAAWCRARAAGSTASVPPAAVRREPLEVRLSLLVLVRGPAVLLAAPGAAPVADLEVAAPPARADFTGLYRGLHGLPSTPWYPAGGRPAGGRVGAPGDGAPGPWRRALARRGIATTIVDPCGSVAHAVTTYRLEVAVVRAEVAAGAGREPWPDTAWHEWPGAAPPITALARKAMRRAGLTVD